METRGHTRRHLHQPQRRRRPGRASPGHQLGAIGTIIGAGVQYASLNKQLSYLDNEGRDEFMEQVKAQYGVNYDPQANAMTARIMENLSRSVAAIDPSILDKPYNYFVNNDTTFNAFCTIGHNMSVNIGLFEPLNYNENEVVFVLAHEMGHGQENHPIEGVKKSMPLDLLASLAGANGGAAQLGSAILSQIGTANLVTKPMERKRTNWPRIRRRRRLQSRRRSRLMAAHAGKGRLRQDERRHGAVQRSSDQRQPPRYVQRDPDKVEPQRRQGRRRNGYDFHPRQRMVRPGRYGSMSGREQAYLIAGNLAAVYHQNKRPTASVHTQGQMLYVGAQPIADLSARAGPSCRDGPPAGPAVIGITQYLLFSRPK